jgi:phenylpropionate dioxygenase-like ring-hydroxylating dioxygenase large terminal subunit
MSAPTYEAGIQLSAAVRDDADRLVERLVELHARTGTDQATTQWHEPVRKYLDPELWQQEMERVHGRVPLPLALSCELPGPGTYKALDVAGTPVLITRDREGDLHASVNVCRHRGAELMPLGTGSAQRLTCTYHSWTYDLAGCLLGAYGDKTFGPLDKDEMGLKSLPVEERAGIIFLGLAPGMELDLDDWLGDLLPLIEGLGLADCYHWSTKHLPGPNWKVVIDGYLEGYHFASLHRTTVFKTNLSNMAAFDRWGPHQRNAFALRPIADAVDLPPEQRDPATCAGPIIWLFPGLAIAGGWRHQIAVSLVLPGTSPDTSHTEQHILLRGEPKDEEEQKAADNTRDWFHDVVMDEDYDMGFGVQKGLAALADEDFVFGRNEPGVQHFHRVVDALVDGVPPHPAEGLGNYVSPSEVEVVEPQAATPM